VPANSETLDLFGEARLPEGMKYQPDFLSAEEERALLRNIENLPFKEFEFHGFTGKRRTVSFGWRYDFNGGGLGRTKDMPEFLMKLRAQAEAFAGIAPGSFRQLLVTEYAPGAGIGWHKDRAVFGDVAGISLLSSCTFRLRRRTGKGFERKNFIAGPRSVYLLGGPSRTEWEHSIPGVESLRYSVTFRSVLERIAP
jgi:alkylated DNA repair dioxygenase AlkB